MNLPGSGDVGDVPPFRAEIDGEVARHVQIAEEVLHHLTR
jgi:hypothetical protein